MSSIIEKARAYVENVIKKHCGEGFEYHNYEHTQSVTDSAREIANAEELFNSKDKESIELAALFHDVAYYKGRKNHEENSVEMAELFLKEHKLEEKQIQIVKGIIRATKLGHVPTDNLEKVIQDADLAHLGKDNYVETTFLGLRAELYGKAKEPSKLAWIKICISFLENHEYKTNYAKKYFNPTKKQNLLKLYSMAELEGSKHGQSVKMEEKEVLDSENLEVKKKKKKKKPKSDLPEKGIETVFRVALRNHMSLSRIADNKANTLISVNSIIISIALSTLFPKMDNNPYLIYPGLTLIIFSIITILISVLSTIPKTSHGTISKEEVLNKEGNLIFFGNFHKMDLDEYEWAIGELMKDRDYLYKSLTRDLYFLGKVLNRKYILLRYSYYIFMAGLIVSSIIFSLSVNSLS